MSRVRSVRRTPIPVLNRVVYVGNLPYATTEADLRRLVAMPASVRSIQLITHRETGFPRGFAFVVMATPTDAEVAIARLTACVFRGRKLDVNAASPEQRLLRGGL